MLLIGTKLLMTLPPKRDDLMTIDYRTVKVFSTRDENEGFEPRLEAVFSTHQDAVAYIECWSTLYDDVNFWIG